MTPWALSAPTPIAMHAQVQTNMCLHRHLHFHLLPPYSSASALAFVVVCLCVSVNVKYIELLLDLRMRLHLAMSLHLPRIVHIPFPRMVTLHVEIRLRRLEHPSCAFVDVSPSASSSCKIHLAFAFVFCLRLIFRLGFKCVCAFSCKVKCSLILVVGDHYCGEHTHNLKTNTKHTCRHKRAPRI